MSPSQAVVIIELAGFFMSTRTRVLTIYLALICDTPVNSLFNISANLSYEGPCTLKRERSARLCRIHELRPGHGNPWVLTSDLNTTLHEHQKARKSNQPVIDTYISTLESQAHEESQAYRYQSKERKHDSSGDETGDSIHDEFRYGCDTKDGSDEISERR